MAFDEGHGAAGGVFDGIREGRLFVLDELMPSCTVLRPGEEVFRIISLPAGENPADFCRRAGALAQTQTALYDEKPRGATI